MQAIKSCGYNLNSGSIEIEYEDGKKMDILVNRLEDTLELSPVTQSKFDWLVFNEPLEFAELVMSGRLMPYLEWYEKDFLQQEENIRTQLERKHGSEMAVALAMEFMMYES